MKATAFRWVSILALGSTLFACSHAEPAPTASANDPDSVLKSLNMGNRRFIEGNPAHPRQDPARRLELANGQHPKAIILSCSDSRVPPETVFDQGLGDLFVVRVAGNIAGPPELASIEYAVEHLGSKLIVVMGHDSCGAVKAALTTPPGQSAGSPALNQLVADIQRNLEHERIAVASDDPAIERPVMANVDAVAEDLVHRSAIIREHVEKGDLHIVRAIYQLPTGNVNFWINR